MKKIILMTASSLALAGVVACSQASEEVRVADATYENQTTMTEDRDPEVMELDELADVGAVVIDDDEAETMVLSSNQYEARELIGEDVWGPEGDAVATVADVMLDDSGKINAYILRHEGIFGTMGDLVKVSPDVTTIAFDEERDPEVMVTLMEEAIDDAIEWDQNGLNDYRLASEIIGTNAVVAGSDDEEVRITDIIMNTNGTAEYALLAEGFLDSLGDERAVIPFEKVVVEQGDGGLVINMTTDEVSAAPTIDGLEND